MKKLVSFLIILLLLSPQTITAADTELLTAPWNFVIQNGASEKYQNIPTNSLNGKDRLVLTYDLHGTCILGNDASAIIFDQNGWNYASLSNYGQNCLDGVQTVTIPLSHFINDQTQQPINTSANVGTFHARFWKDGGPWNVDITSAVLKDAAPPPADPTWDIQSVDVMKYSKDVVCNQPTSTFITQQVEKAVEIGANYIAVSAFYDNPSCGNSTTLLTAWVNAARSHNLKVWFRMKDLV